MPYVYVVSSSYQRIQAWSHKSQIETVIGITLYFLQFEKK